MKRRFVVAAGGAAMGTALVLSGCSGSGTDNTGAMRLTAGEALVKTSQKTGQADTFKADLTVSEPSDGGNRVHATGQFRLRPELTFSARLDEVTRGGQAVPGVKGQAIYTGDVLYAKVPQQFSQLVAGGKPWVKVEVNQAGRQAGFDVKGLVEQVRKVNPAEQTKMFTGSKDARRVGEETVDGVKTTHYTGTVTVRDALNRLDAQTRERVRQWFPGGTANEKIAFDLWTDEDQLPRKLVSKGDAKSGRTGTVTVLYSDYGKSFSVNPPPADQVGELSLGAFLGGRPAPRN